MTNRTDMVTRLRQELGEPNADSVWADDYLNQLFIEGVEWLAYEFPVVGEAFVTVTAGTRVYAYPYAAKRVLGIELPPGKRLPRDGASLITDVDPAPYEGVTRQGWMGDGVNIYIRNAPAGDEVGAGKMRVHIAKGYDRPDPVDDWTGPADMVRLLVLWAAREAWAWLDGRSTKRGRSGAGYGRQLAEAGTALEREMARRRRSVSFSSRTLEEAL